MVVEERLAGLRVEEEEALESGEEDRDLGLGSRAPK